VAPLTTVMCHHSVPQRATSRFVSCQPPLPKLSNTNHRLQPLADQPLRPPLQHSGDPNKRPEIRKQQPTGSQAKPTNQIPFRHSFKHFICVINLSTSLLFSFTNRGLHPSPTSTQNTNGRQRSPCPSRLPPLPASIIHQPPQIKPSHLNRQSIAKPTNKPKPN